MQKGFTIIEIAIVVTIIGVIAAIAIPSYNKYVVRTNRTAMQAEMSRIAQELQRYQTANRNSFAGANTADNLKKMGFKSPFPEGKNHYTLDLSVLDSNRDWTLTATPASAQQNGDGIIVLNHRGEKCRGKGTVKCTPSASSNWD